MLQLKIKCKSTVKVDFFVGFYQKVFIFAPLKKKKVLDL